MNKKIVLFISSLNAFGLLDYLVSKNLLGCVVVANNNSADTHNLVQVLTQYKLPFFLDYQDDSKNIEALNQFNVNLALLFGFSTKVSVKIIEFFQGNIFNIHASSLPKYRGKNPIFWQLKKGEENSSLVIHKVTQEFDEGDIVLKKEFKIDKSDTFGILNGLISQLVISLVDEFLELYEKDDLCFTSQIGEKSFAREVVQKDIVIDWEKMKSLEVYNLTRACNPIFEGAKCMWKNAMISIYEATVVDMDNFGLEAGTIVYIGYPQGLIVTTIDGTIRVDLISVPDGIFSGLRFAKRFNLDVGEKLSTIKL